MVTVSITTVEMVQKIEKFVKQDGRINLQCEGEID